MNIRIKVNLVFYDIIRKDDRLFINVNSLVFLVFSSIIYVKMYTMLIFFLTTFASPRVIFKI